MCKSLDATLMMARQLALSVLNYHCDIAKQAHMGSALNHVRVSGLNAESEQHKTPPAKASG
jgi:hypothetical protein